MSRIFHISGQLKKDGDLVLKDCDFDAFLVMREDKTAYGYIAKVFQDGELEKSGKESIAGIIILGDETSKPRIAFCENVAKTKSKRHNHHLSAKNISKKHIITYTPALNMLARLHLSQTRKSGFFML